MKVHQFYTHNSLRNFTYILELDSTLWVIDPWDADQVIDWIEPLKKKLTTIINTHEHWDHIRGNEKLRKKYDAKVWAHEKAKGKIHPIDRMLKAHENIEIEEAYQLRVLDTPGHTMAHLCFVVSHHNKDLYLFSGDTLFNAGVGNCHNGGDPEVLYNTVHNQLMKLDDDVILYPGHDYLMNNLGFTLSVEPKNSKAQEILNQYEQKGWSEGEWQSTLEIEKEMNTFLRLKSEGLKNELQLDSPKQVFLKLRELRNHW